MQGGLFEYGYEQSSLSTSGRVELGVSQPEKKQAVPSWTKPRMSLPPLPSADGCPWITSADRSVLLKPSVIAAKFVVEPVP